MLKSRTSALLQQVDHLIVKHAKTNPELLHDLYEHRAALQDALRRGSPLEVAKSALRISVWVKFIIDHLPDD